MDGSSTPSASGARIFLNDPKGKMIEYALCFAFSISNNEAEYEAFLTNLKLATKMEVLELQVFSEL